MKRHSIAVALAALSIAGAAVAAGNDTATSTAGAMNDQSSSQHAGTSANAPSANDQAGTAAHDQTTSQQPSQSSGASSSQNTNASDEQNNPQIVRSAQQALKQKGFDVGAVDGQLGPNTESALRNFQQAQGLPQGGNLDQQTLSALGVDQSQVSGAMSTESSPSKQGSMSSQGQQGATSGQESQRQGSMQQGSATQSSGSYK